jgi:hypothetical protein
LSKSIRLRAENRFAAADADQLSVPGYLPDDPNQLVNTPTLARIIDVSPRTIEQWYHQRKIPVFLISQKCVRFRLRDVIKTLEDRYLIKEINLEKKGGATA